MTEMVPELTNGEFNEFIKEGTVLMDFFAEWCMPCVMMSPIIEDLAEEFKGKVKFGKVNIDDYNQVAEKFEVTSIPTFLLIKNGEVKSRLTGALNQEDIEKMIQDNLN